MLDIMLVSAMCCLHSQGIGHCNKKYSLANMFPTWHLKWKPQLQIMFKRIAHRAHTFATHIKLMRAFVHNYFIRFAYKGSYSVSYLASASGHHGPPTQVPPPHGQSPICYMYQMPAFIFQAQMGPPNCVAGGDFCYTTKQHQTKHASGGFGGQGYANSHTWLPEMVQNTQWSP